MNILRQIKGLILLLVIPALLLLMGNAVFNLHVHKSSDGRMFVHAHPIHEQGNPSTPGSGHSHSAGECISIQHITSILFVLGKAICLGLVLNVVFKKFETASFHFILSHVDYLLPNRAPPALL